MGYQGGTHVNARMGLGFLDLIVLKMENVFLKKKGPCVNVTGAGPIWGQNVQRKACNHVKAVFKVMRFKEIPASRSRRKNASVTLDLCVMTIAPTMVHVIAVGAGMVLNFRTISASNRHGRRAKENITLECHTLKKRRLVRVDSVPSKDSRHLLMMIMATLRPPMLSFIL